MKHKYFALIAFAALSLTVSAQAEIREIKSYADSSVQADVASGKPTRWASVNKPLKIIFFDDKRYNLESVEKELATTGIEFVGYRYGFLDQEVAGFRPDIANVEWVGFKQTGRILSDRETAKLIFSK